MKKVSLAEWEAVENLPAIAGHLFILNASKAGPMCSTGKVHFIFSGDASWYGSPAGRLGTFKEDKGYYCLQSHAANMNNHLVDGTRLPDSEVYGKEHPNWNRHIQAFRTLLMYYVERGWVELEDDLAQEFAKLKTQEIKQEVTV